MGSKKRLPRNEGGSASALGLSGPARTSITLRPAELLDRPRRPLSRGFNPGGCPSRPLVSARRKDSIVISPIASDRRSMPRRSWSPRSRAPSSVHHSASCQRCATPTISAPGSRSCARMIAPSFAPPAPHRRRRTTCSRFAPSPTNPSKPSNCPAISSSATDRRCPLDEAPRSRLQARPYSVRGRPLSP
jgi:hypothetical protein